MLEVIHKWKGNVWQDITESFKAFRKIFSLLGWTFSQSLLNSVKTGFAGKPSSSPFQRISSKNQFGIKFLFLQSSLCYLIEIYGSCSSNYYNCSESKTTRTLHNWQNKLLDMKHSINRYVCNIPYESTNILHYINVYIYNHSRKSMQKCISKQNPNHPHLPTLWNWTLPHIEMTQNVNSKYKSQFSYFTAHHHRLRYVTKTTKCVPLCHVVINDLPKRETAQNLIPSCQIEHSDKIENVSTFHDIHKNPNSISTLDWT